MKKTLLLTGVSGFLGRYVVRCYREMGWEVIGVDRTALENAPQSDLTRYIQTQLPDDRLDLVLAEARPQMCIHCAGRASIGLSVEDPLPDFRDGPELVLDLLERIRNHSPETGFILLSSAAVYGDPQSLPVSEEQPASPLSPYGYHKWMSEILCREFANVYGLKTAAARVFSAYGPGLRRQVIWDICRKALTDSEIFLQGTGNESRDFIHGRDIARGIACIADHAPMNGEAYNLASGDEVTIRQLAEIILGALKLKREFYFDGVIPVGVPSRWAADLQRIAALGFTPQIQLEAGIQIFSEWCRAELIGA
jgi:UDP-glucose 4-epimerase